VADRRYNAKLILPDGTEKPSLIVYFPPTLTGEEVEDIGREILAVFSGTLCSDVEDEEGRGTTTEDMLDAGVLDADGVQEAPAPKPPQWPAGLLDRIKAAEQRIADNHAPRRIPADPHGDVDLVLAEVRYLIEGCWPPFWIKDAAGVQGTPPAEPHSLVGFLEKLRPLTDYGRPGTRDTEQAELRRALDSAIVLARALTSALGVPEFDSGLGEPPKEEASPKPGTLGVTGRDADTNRHQPPMPDGADR
jgi:hypothetical protein